MKLVGYELRKLIQQKTAVFLLIGIFLLGEYLFSVSSVMQNARLEVSCRSEAEEIELMLQGKSIEEGLSLLEEEEASQETVDYLADFAKQQMLKKYMESYQYLLSYPDYLSSVTEQAEQMEKVAVFQKQGSYAISNIRKTKNDFLRLEDVTPQADPAEWIVRGISVSFPSLLLIVQVVILSVCLFGYDQEGDRKRILTMQFRGRLPVSCAKLVCLLLGVVLLTLAMYIGFLLQSYWTDGSGSVYAPIQSFSECKRCVWKVNCLEFLLLFMGNKILAMMFWAALAAIAVTIARSSGGILLFGGVYGFFWLLYTRISNMSVMAPLAHINPAAWTDTWVWMSTYQNVNLFQHAVGFNTCFYAGVVIGIAGISAAAVILFPRYIRPQTPHVLQRLKGTVSGLFGRTAQTASLLWQQLYELLGYRNRFLLCILILLGIVYAGTRQDNGYYYLEKATYNSYLNTIQGRYTEETETFLTAEEAYLNRTDGYLESLEEAYDKGELDKAEYDRLVLAFEREAEQKIEGFSKVKEQWLLVSKVQESGQGTAGFFQKYMAEELFDNTDQELFLLQLFLLLFLMLAAPYNRMEAACESLFLAAPRGRGLRLRVRGLLNGISACIIGAGIFAAWYSSVFTAYQAQDFSISAACLPLFWGWKSEITLGQLMIWSWAAKGLGIVCIALVTVGISYLNLEATVYYLLLGVLLEGPNLLIMAGIPAGWFSLTGFFEAERLIGQSPIGFLCYAVIMVGGSTLFTILLYRRKAGRLPEAWKGRA